MQGAGRADEGVERQGKETSAKDDAMMIKRKILEIDDESATMRQCATACAKVNVIIDGKAKIVRRIL